MERRCVPVLRLVFDWHTVLCSPLSVWPFVALVISSIATALRNSVHTVCLSPEVACLVHGLLVFTVILYCLKECLCVVSLHQNNLPSFQIEDRILRRKGGVGGWAACFCFMMKSRSSVRSVPKSVSFCAWFWRALCVSLGGTGGELITLDITDKPHHFLNSVLQQLYL